MFALLGFELCETCILLPYVLCPLCLAWQGNMAWETDGKILKMHCPHKRGKTFDQYCT